MTIFNEYAKVYDLFYENKDYQSEADYVHQLIKQHHPTTKTLLELGCGTGKHAKHFSDYGYHVCGIDMSKSMLDIARSHPTENHSLSFIKGDARSIRLQKTFDTVISLFHVINYQTSDEDLTNLLETARAHLQPGGLFIFDFWYGPAVLTDHPQRRTKTVEKNNMTITKVAEPELKPDENRIDIQLMVTIQTHHAHTQEIHELHSMRYLFLPEIRSLLKNTHFALKHAFQWMKSDQTLSLDNWLGVIIAEAQ